MDIWFTSDTHFGHQAIIKHIQRPFQTTQEMDETILQGLNKVLKRTDQLWHLGDYCWQASKAGHYRQRLNTRQLHIIQGNHDANSLAKIGRASCRERV